MVESTPLETVPPLLPARPPTPPRESQHNTTKPGLVGRFHQSSAPVPSTLTPDSSAESPSASGSSRKKVGFSDWPEYNEPPTVSFDGKGVLKHAVQPLPPSAERKPSKSILKAHNGNQEQEPFGIDGNAALLPSHHYATFAKMLESIVQQLAGSDRISKVDAYLMLSGSLKASENVPDVKALKEKMGFLCQYIERDLTQKLENGKPDSSLIVNAVTLLGCFLQKPTIAESFPTDFMVHLVDHTIRVFEDGSMSKEVTKHLMFILAQQKFSSKVMNGERIGRLISALHSVEAKVKGKSIVQSRVQIYRTLLRQSRAHMLAHTIWIEDLMTDMLSSLKDIRAAAITFGLEAGFSLGMENNASKAVQNLFKSQHPAGEKFGDYYIERLKAPIKKDAKNREDSPAVPQIWSVVILFLRSKPQLLEQWQFMAPFLGVLSACFNIADISTRTEAHYAWNRFIFAVRPNEKTSPKLRAILSQLIILQLQRKSTSGRKNTMSNIYTLLYYSLNPRSMSGELDLYWDEYLAPLIEDHLAPPKKESSVSEMSKQDAGDACLILQSLFDSKTPRKWSETRAMDNLLQNGMAAKELPALDSKWLRRNHARVFQLLNPLVRNLYWDLGEDSAITRLWRAYVTSIASPAAMEVKVSIDAMSCIACMFDALHKLLSTGPEGLGILCSSAASNKHVAFWKGFETIVTAAIDGLGILPFTEKNLSIAHNNFIAVATPSTQPTKVRLETKSPLYHLISLLSNPSSTLDFDHGFSQMMHTILVPFFEQKSSKQARLAFVAELIRLLPGEGTPPVKSLWQVFADFATSATDMREKKENDAPSDLPLGNDYRNVVNILETGVLLSPQRPLPRWKVLFDTLGNSAILDAGDSGKAIAVIEPLAKSLNARGSVAETGVAGLLYLSTMLVKVSYPKDRQALDAAERKMWGSKQSGTKTTSFNPYNHLYVYTQSSLESAYRSFSKNHVHEYADIISAVSGLLGRCPAQLLHAVLASLQSGIAIWIIDAESKLTGGNTLSQAIMSLWAMISKLIPMLRQYYSHTEILSELEVLICAGLESKHKAVVNNTIGLWNSTFGSCQDGLEYPPIAKNALLKLLPKVELQLPFFPESLEAEASTGHRQITNQIDHHDEPSQFSGLSSMDSAIKGYLAPNLGPKVLHNLRQRQSTPQVIIEIKGSRTLKRSREATPEVNRRKSKRRDVTPRMRHDDSQIRFEAIPSSSPVIDRVVDSQLLTEKQKEVKERQQAEAAMFPDLRSSPRPRGKVPESEDFDLELPLHRSSSKIRDKISREIERETTPPVAIPSDDDNFVTSSPTPTRSLRGHPDDPPSSPPEAVVKRRSPVLDEQISSSPPEGTPEPANAEDPSIPAITEPELTSKDHDHNMPSSPREDAFRHEAPEIPPSIHEDTSVHGYDTTVSAVMGTTEASIDEEDGLPSAGAALNYENETTVSLDPSAQFDPDAIDIKQTVSTYDLSTEERGSSPAEDPSDQLRASQIEHEAAMTSVEAQRGDHQAMQPSSTAESISESVPSSIAELAIQPVHDPQPPGTPVHRGAETAEQQSPKTPQFVDALSSPAGSDKHDIFEDAVSSPRLNIDKGPRTQCSSSSPLSEIDESSMLRVMEQYDQGSGRHVSFLDDKENRPRRTRSSSPKDQPEMPSSSVSASAPLRKSALRKKSGLQQSSQVYKEIQPVADQLQTSSVPSLIPETPAPKPAEQPVMRYYDDHGVEVNMDETIIVDTSILEKDSGRRMVKRSPRKRLGKKRKYVEDAASTDEIPDSQDAKIEEDPVSPSKAPAAPAIQKRKAQRSRWSEVGMEIASSQEIIQSFLSRDPDALMTEVEEDVHRANQLIVDETSLPEEPKPEEEMQGAPEDEEMRVTADEVREERLNATQPVEGFAMEEDVIMDTVLIEGTSSPDPDVIAETTFDDSSSADKSSSAINKSEDDSRAVIIPVSEVEVLTPEVPVHKTRPGADAPGVERVDVAPEVSFDETSSGAAIQETTLGANHSEIRIPGEGGKFRDETREQRQGPDGPVIQKPEADTVPMESALEEKPPVTMQGMKDKLQSLITDLHSAALSRREVSELEDMFMDAKRVLYGAELRGRELADM